jgi:hypothetical protein
VNQHDAGEGYEREPWFEPGPAVPDDPFAPAPPFPPEERWVDPPSSFTPSGFAFRRAPTTPAEPPPPPGTVDPWVELRNQVIDRLASMNSRHRHHAWQARNGPKPLCPHGLAVFYREKDLDRDPARWVLRTATRLMLAGEESEDLPLLLYHLANIAEEYLQDDTRFDPRSGATRMVQRVEPMAASAEYVGVGVSSLDSPVDPRTGQGGWWRNVQRSVAGGWDIPGRMYAHLVDDTRILMDRRGEREGALFQVTATDNLNMVHGRFSRSWRWDKDRPPALLRDPTTLGVWRELGRLNDLFFQGSRAL